MKTNKEIIATWETEGIYTDWCAIDSYDPVMQTETRVFVGTEDDAWAMMNGHYAVTQDVPLNYYRCSYISTSAAKEYFDGIARK